MAPNPTAPPSDAVPEAARQLVAGRRLAIIMEDDERRRTASLARTVLSCTTDRNHVLWVRNPRREAMSAQAAMVQIVGTALPGPDYDLGRQAQRRLRDDYGADAQVIVVVDQADCLDVEAMLAIASLAEASETAGFALQILFVSSAAFGLALADDRLSGLRAALFGPADAATVRDPAGANDARGSMIGSVAAAILVALAIGVLVTQTSLFDPRPAPSVAATAPQPIIPQPTIPPTATADTAPPQPVAPLPVLAPPPALQPPPSLAEAPPSPLPALRPPALAAQGPVPSVARRPAVPSLQPQPAPPRDLAYADPPRRPPPGAAPGRPGANSDMTAALSAPPAPPEIARLDRLQAEFEVHIRTMNPPLPRLSPQQRSLLFRQFLEWRGLHP